MTNETIETDFKSMVFRIPTDLKRDMRIAMMKNDITIQDCFQAFAEFLVAYDKNGKSIEADVFAAILKRAQALSASPI